MIESLSAIKNPISYKNKNRLLTYEPEDWLKDKNAEPHFKKLCSYKQYSVYSVCAQWPLCEACETTQVQGR